MRLPKVVVITSIQAFVIAFIVLVWAYLVDNKTLDPFIIPHPLAVAYAIGRNYHVVLTLFGQTCFHAGMGFLLSISLGLTIGFLLAWSRSLHRILSPYILFLFMVPKITTIPFFLSFFGFRSLMRIMFAFFHGFFPICINTMRGMLQVRKSLLDTAIVFGARPFQILREVVFPYTLPNILTGIRQSVMANFTGAIIAELWFGGGVGGYIKDNSVRFMPENVFSAVFIIALICIIINQSLLFIERKASHWR